MPNKYFTDNTTKDDDNFLIMVPIFNDWKSLQKLLVHIDRVLSANQIPAEILVVDDGSSIAQPMDFISYDFQAINKVMILELRRNLGHQRAIAIGLAYVGDLHTYPSVVVMDGDGEDSPDDIIRLIDKYQQEGKNKIIFARRSERSETRLFKLFYLIYKWLYKLLTDEDIRVGNFSLIPHRILPRLVVVSEIWNHYASGILKAKIPYVEIHSKRSTRLAGESKMNFTSLVMHGLSAISVYSDVAGIRLLVMTLFLILFTIIALIVVVLVKFMTDLSIPGWTSYVSGILVIILMQSIMFSLFFSFITLNSRNNSNFLPIRDYRYFILSFQEVFKKS